MASILNLCDAELLLILSFAVDLAAPFDRVKTLSSKLFEAGLGVVKHPVEQSLADGEFEVKFPLSSEQVKIHSMSQQY